MIHSDCCAANLRRRRGPHSTPFFPFQQPPRAHTNRVLPTQISVADIGLRGAVPVRDGWCAYADHRVGRGRERPTRQSRAGAADAPVAGRRQVGVRQDRPSVATAGD